MRTSGAVVNRASASPKPLTGRKVLFMLLAFFGVVIGVNLTMIRLASMTLPGTEVDSAYAASLAYEKEIAAAREQDARSWKVDAHLARSADGDTALEVKARDGSGKALTGLKFTGRLERPTDRRADRVIALSEVTGGIYRGSGRAVGPGQWNLVLESEADGRRLFMSRNRVVLN
ncbi:MULTISPECIES: FixH family protein [Bradyrhizobium]|uniref:Nitrogen fixation protein FixH n=2 Tax=Bradyrhizobium valentinum TaxID=1518501 RepID=A0A0R3KWB7_9BRAD|nr:MULTISPECIES: FixH family protein [Bradyrhizobium]KRQ97087.1 nitrogen fixation protein FixH [Bradyrhizobium valentinum]